MPAHGNQQPPSHGVTSQYTRDVSPCPAPGTHNRRRRAPASEPWKESHNCTRPVTLGVYRGSIVLRTKRSGSRTRRHGGGQRGEVWGLSDASRLRLIQRLATVDARTLSLPVMVTLTYHHGHQRDDAAHTADRRAWVARVRRRYPAICLLWRLELQRRGAPHYHVIMWLPYGDDRLQSSAAQRELATMWHEIADPTSHAHARHGADVRALDSRRHGYHYIAKYVAKETTDAEREFPGRRWGMVGDVPTRARAVLHITEDERRALLDVIARWLRQRTNRHQWVDWYTSTCPSQTILCDADIQRDLLAGAGIDIPPELQEILDADAIDRQPNADHQQRRLR